MDAATKSKNPQRDFPPLTAAEIGSALGISPQAARQRLRHIPATGKKLVSGNRANAWDASALPAALVSRLVRLAHARGYQTAGEMFSARFKAWQPPVPLSEISDECLAEAARLKEALLPSLRKKFVVSQADFMGEGLADFEKVFGHRISGRHFRTLIQRTRERDGGRENWERLELYLPKRPAGKLKSSEPKPEFSRLLEIMNDGGPRVKLKGNRQVPVAPDEAIWTCACESIKDIPCPRKRAVRQLLDFIWEHAPTLAPSREALRKTLARRLARSQAGESFDKRDGNGADDGEVTRQIKSLTWFLPAAEFFYLLTNRTQNSGSVPEAIRRVISLPDLPAGWNNAIRNRFLKKVGLKKIIPVCPDDLHKTILARERAGQAMVPASIANAIKWKVPARVIEFYRRPHEAALNNFSCPGTMMMVRREGCEPMFARAGDIIEADDGSINFPVCIPWTSPNGQLITETPCSAKFGVIVGRFQWLRSMDVATRFRPAWVFVARQRGGYRGADVLTLLHGLTLQHGAWEEYRFEQGVFKCHLVKRAIELLGSRLHTVISPNDKPFIEGGFNQDWTKLSVHFPQCDLGRYRGDTEQANKLMQSCRRGATDPRKYFPMLSDALAAFAEITKEENATLVKSRNSGQWVPEERWQRETTRSPLRQVEQNKMFMFAPSAVEWTVRGMLIGGRVRLFEDISVPFDFSAPWLQEFSGARMRLHFDPAAPKCQATPVLLQAWNDHRAGEVLPPLQQVNETAGYIRMVLGWGEDIATAGLKAKQQAAVAMRREVRTIMPGGKSGYSKSEVKALDASGILECGGLAKEIVPDGKETSASRLAQNLGVTGMTSRRAELAAKMTEVEKFERENRHLFV